MPILEDVKYAVKVVATAETVTVTFWEIRHRVWLHHRKAGRLPEKTARSDDPRRALCLLCPPAISDGICRRG